jgi:hypothetical protein
MFNTHHYNYQYYYSTYASQKECLLFCPTPLLPTM